MIRDSKEAKIKSLYFCKLCSNVSAAKNCRVKENSISCAAS
jgi:hypothetical protein